jgi:hypothetical protein
MINHLQKGLQRRTPDLIRGKAWTSESRARQSALIRRWQPWRRSTGPRTDSGKPRCAQNALKHYYRSAEWLYIARRTRHTLRWPPATSPHSILSSLGEAPLPQPTRDRQQPSKGCTFPGGAS